MFILHTQKILATQKWFLKNALHCASVGNIQTWLSTFYQLLYFAQWLSTWVHVLSACSAGSLFHCSSVDHGWFNSVLWERISWNNSRPNQPNTPKGYYGEKVPPQFQIIINHYNFFLELKHFKFEQNYRNNYKDLWHQRYTIKI